MQGNKATTLWATARANLIGINLGVLRKYIAYCLLEQSNSKNQWHAYLHMIVKRLGRTNEQTVSSKDVTRSRCAMFLLLVVTTSIVA
jgi:hypothetical protein